MDVGMLTEAYYAAVSEYHRVSHQAIRISMQVNLVQVAVQALEASGAGSGPDKQALEARRQHLALLARQVEDMRPQFERLRSDIDALAQRINQVVQPDRHVAYAHELVFG